jgi:ribosomal protein L29
MAKRITSTELRKMSAQDLRDDIRMTKVSIATLHIRVRLQKEKDTAKYKREKKNLARMQTVLSEIDAISLRKEKEKVSSPSKK